MPLAPAGRLTRWLWQADPGSERANLLEELRDARRMVERALGHEPTNGKVAA